jgi:hypothetical protein
MAERALKKEKTWLLHTGGKKRNPADPGRVVFLPDQYGDAALMSGGASLNAITGDVRYGIDLHSYPLEIVDYFGHYFLPVEKAA